MLAPHRSTKGKMKPQASLDTTPRTSVDTTDENADAPAPVLPSSTELFYFYAQNLEQCAKLSTGKPLFDLCKVHKKWLRIYAGMVNPNIYVAALKCVSIRRGCPCHEKAVRDGSLHILYMY